MPLLNQDEEPKTTFQLEDGKKYNVGNEYIEAFIEENPNATTIMEREGKKHRVRAIDYQLFNLSAPEEEKRAVDNKFGVIDRSLKQTSAMTDAYGEHFDNMQEYGAGMGQTKENKPQFNPTTGKIEKTYLTPQGNRHTDKNTADMESFKYRRSVSDTTVSGQLQTAYKRLEELRQQEQTRASEVHEDLAEEYRKNTAPLASLLFAQTYVPAQQADKTKRSLAVAIRETEETIKTLEEQRDREGGKDIGFWRGFGRVAGDIRTWDLGLGDIQDAVTMLDATDPQENLTDGEVEAQGAMLEAKQIQEQTEQQYGGNASFWNRAGMMAGHMPSFMLDFAITGGGFSGLSAMSTAGTKAATKVVGKEVVEEIAKQGFKSYVKSNGAKGAVQGATNWTIKALGTTADDLLIRAPLMTNTIQVAKTASDVIDRKLGGVVEGEDGTLSLENENTWSDAIWQSEANSIVENYSEMFGTHLDPVLSLGNVSKLANVIGAKRLSGILAKADAGTLGGIMGTTNEMFNKMGVSDYVGEVTEEYYGQLWRTMLNLDDAYQQNPDGSRTNLLASGQFHGDIWGGMALTMGLMGAGKAGVSAAGYYSMKHDVSNADATANEMLGAEVWEPLRSTIDLITNDDIGGVAEVIVSDPKFTQEEKVAVLDYMEHSLNLRGFNLASMAQSRSEEMSDQDREINESYTNGYNIATTQEMVDANNMLTLQSQRLTEAFGNDAVDILTTDPIGGIKAIVRDEYDEEKMGIAFDFINAKQIYNGMIQRVRDDIDSRISQSNAMIASRINKTSGAIQSAILKIDDRSVNIVSGNVVSFPDGTGIDIEQSDKSLIIRDAETGALEQISPDAILKVDEPIDPAEQSELASQTIREEFAQAAADKIDGVADFNAGASHIIVGENGDQVNIQITPNEQGIIDNGDGTINVSDGAQIFALPKEVIQESANVTNMARVVEFEQQRSIDNAPQTNTALPYELGDEFVINHNGSPVRARIAEPLNADGMILVETDTPINGSMVAQFTPDALSDMVVEYGGQTIEQTTPEQSTTPVEQPAINEEQSTNEEVPEVQPTALEQIPKSENGEPLYDQADSDTAWDAIVEQTDGDEQIAQSVIEATIADKESELKKIEKAKLKGAVSIAEKIAAEKERKTIIDNIQQQINQWKKIASTSTRRQQEAESIRRKQVEEVAAAQKVEEERLREEREEAERIEREALNGVPDMLNDTPQDARARSYRRVNGHKVDRQLPIQYLQGNEVAVKFSNDAIPTGSVAIIDASQLQPSHIQGVRNPLHFIDEAQPKERNDEASILSAQKIASNIRPEEITSSVTAYTGAPTINSRGEVIQGNNRSDALRLMWQGQSEQAQTYKQYLMDHAEEFGLNPEEVGAVEQPVLVNMLDVEDDNAIGLGQYVAQDTESGGVERIKPKNTLQRMGADMQSFSNILLSSSNEEASFLSLVDSNGAKVLKWMNQKGYITPTQYRSALDSRGNLTAEVKNDIKGIMYQNIFQGNSTRLEEMFNLLPSKAQKAILATAFRDYDSPSGERMVEEIQNSIKAYYALSRSKEFVDAKNNNDTHLAVESWKNQYQMDDSTGQSYLPADNFSNFALHLATTYKGESQSSVQNTFKQLYDLVQGTQEENLFEQPDNTPRTLAQAVNEVLKFEYNGEKRSVALVGDNKTSQSRGHGKAEYVEPRERVQGGEELADNTGGVIGDGSTGGNSSDSSVTAGGTTTAERTDDEQRETNSRGVVADSASETQSISDRGDIRVLEEGLGTNGYEYSVDSERDRRTAESERLVKVAKGNNLFIPLSKTKDYGKKYPKKTGESVVYRNEDQGKVYKVKNPYAKAALKNGVQPEDAIFEHQIHNLLFPETEYTLEGISQEYGDELRLVLSQNFIQTYGHPTSEQIAEALAKRGLYPEDNYSFGNDLVSVTDVEGDNVLLGDNGELYFIDPIIRFKQPAKAVIEALTAQSLPTIGEVIETAEAETNTNPTEAQKKAGNYKKGHIQVGSFNISIEQPKGSVRSGVDANGKEWQVTMNNTYGYIRGTEGVDGDHIDVFLSSDIDGWNGRRVFVIDQYNPDGSFDEHKVMLGFNEVEEAEYNYLQNYEQGWESSRKIVPTPVLIEDFEKWINSSHRKTKPFAEYKSVKTDTEQEQPLSLEDMSESITAPESAQSTEVAEPKSKWVAEEDADEFAKLRAAMRSKLGQLNSGIDPEVLAIGCKMSYLLMKNGVRKFNSYATAMIEEIGEVIRPMLKSLYEATRYTPEVQESNWANELSAPDEVYNFNVATFDKSNNDPISTAEMVVAEQEASKKAEEAKTKIKKKRAPKGKKSLNSQQTDSLDLFGSVTNNNKSADGKQQTTGGENRASDNGVSQGESIGSRTTVDSVLDGDLQDGRNERGSDSGAQGEVGEREQSITDRPTGGLPRLNNINNNHSERGVDHAPTSVDARIKANIEAIELSHQLLESGDNATAEQMAILRKFSGWGGLGRAFSNTDYSNRLQQLLGTDGYQDAITSANSSYYTPAQVIDTLWDIAEQVGFKGGTILEGSAGVGNIIGQMPIHIGENSDIHAVEIDPTSGGILSLLYPDANVEIQGFEQTRIQNGSVDLAITNVPFVTGLRVNDTTGDKDLSKKFHNIHDFCIAKNVRKLREGGIGIFISSNGTLDSSKRLRDWVVNEGGSDFIGAFRMNNRTFVGTAVTSDIIVVRKRINAQKSPNAIDVSIVSGERSVEYDTGETRKVKGVETAIIKPLSMDYNKYFIDNPQYMAGEMRFGFENDETFRPTSKGLYPISGKDQSQMLPDFVKSLSSEEQQKRSEESASANDTSTDGKKVGELYVKDGSLVVAGVDGSYPLEVNKNKVKGHTKVECFNAYSAIKDALSDVLAYQSENDSDTNLQPLLDALNKAYDSFVKTYGHFNSNTSIAFLRNDVDYPSVFSLETYEEVGDATGKRTKKFGKTDVFSQRVIEKEKEPTPTNVKDGIIASVFKFGRIDVPYISSHLGQSADSVKEEIIKSGYGFEDPVTRQIELSYQYLSGNVREKRRQAEANNTNGEYNTNIKALDSVMPMEIPAHLIDFTLGSSWIAPKLYDDYVKDRTNVDVNFSAVGGTWFMKDPSGTYNEKNRSMGVTSAIFHKLIMGHTLIEAAIQNRSISVSQTSKKSDGSTETITDKDATQACAAKIDEIRQDFKDWARVQMQSDSEMSDAMCRIYNDTFNNYVPMNIPDEFVPEYFGGAAHKFRMKPHQGKAIVRGTMQPLLLAHEVGTGKTFTLISTAMEMRRLGTARKPMIVVQNATVGQFVRSAKELYPNAKVLTLEDADRNAQGRKNFYAKIRYNDWDMIVVPQSTFEFIPDSEERQMQFIQERIDEKMTVLEQMQDADPDAKSVITRQAEKEIETLELQLAALTNGTSKKRTANQEKRLAITKQNAEIKAIDMLDRRTDDVENFDDMGIDALLIDEAHEYKHLGFATAMQRGVKGVDPSYSKKSQGVFLKTQAVLENNNGRNVIFATGTPISNTAAEIWTFMRYLMPADTMKEYGMYYFDDFVRNFGNIQQMLEFTTSGKYKESNRFAGYVNLPELVRIWSGVSDTVLTKEAEGVNDKIPSIEGEKAHDLYLPQTRALRSIMKFVKSQLEVFEKMSGKEKKENSHIPLTMYGIAKAAAVDARLVQSDAEDAEQSKTNEAVRQTLRALKDSAKYKGTVAIFTDNYRNRHSGFNLYEDVRKKLIANGVPADQIIVMKSGMSIKKKLDIFAKVNSGEVRVVLGSTFTLGTGVNIQERLHTLIHLDAPNRPMDYTQRNGRILRQGNLHKDMGIPVRVLRFGVEDSLDVTAYQRLKTKGAIADSIMNGKQMLVNSMTNRVLEEEEDAFGDTIAQLSGSEYAMLKNNAEKNVRKYESRKKQWEADQTYIHNAKPRLKGLINVAEKRIAQNNEYLQSVQSAFVDGKYESIVIGKNKFTSIDGMADFFKQYNKSITEAMQKMKDAGTSTDEQTRELSISLGDYTFVVTTVLSKETVNGGNGSLFNEVHRKMTYSCPALGIEDAPVHQMLLRNAVVDITKNVITGGDFAEIIDAAERSIQHNRSELDQLLSREGKPFEHTEELNQAHAQYKEYSELMKVELEAKEAKYAEMDQSVEAVDDLAELEDEDDVMFRDAEFDISDFTPEEQEIIDNAGDNAFKAPSGETSNLTRKQWAQVRTQAFKEWFGDWENDPKNSSKVVDANGEPLVVYHGSSSNNITEFDRNRSTREGSGLKEFGHFFTTNRDIAERYADTPKRKELLDQINSDIARLEKLQEESKSGREYLSIQDELDLLEAQKDGRIYETFLNLRNMFEVDAEGKTFYEGRNKISVPLSYKTAVGIDAIEALAGENTMDRSVKADGIKMSNVIELSIGTDNPTTLEHFFTKFGGDSYQVFDARNIKSATDNNGEFSAISNDMRYRNQEMVKQEEYEAISHSKPTRANVSEIVDHANSITERLNLSNVEILDSTEGLKGKKRNAKGFYSKSAGKITIVVPNNTSVEDIEQTILHEAVAHYGLRKLFGDHFEQFLDKIFANADETVRKNIVDLSAKNGWDFRKATEEYLATLAEDTNFENAENDGWWQKIKSFFADMLRKLDFSGSVSDNELRYILWKSYENLKGGQANDIFSEATDIAMQDRLRVGEYNSDETLLRDGKPETRERSYARRRYEERVAGGWYQTQESLQDSMLGLREAMSAVVGDKTYIEDIAGFENAYLGENRLSSVNKAEADAFAQTLFKPMLEEVAKIAKTDESHNELVDYLMAKHGIERNILMAERDAKKAATSDDIPYEALLEAYRKRDYAGLTALTGFDDVEVAETEAQTIIDDFEDKHDVANLWNSINNVSKAILQKSYESGMMDKSTFDHIIQMYEYYIPLRGFDEKTSSEAYAYLDNGNSAFNAPIKKAEGRKSKADDPFSNLQSMAESIIMQGNRNKLVKQRFLNFALNHPSDLISVSDLWVEYDDVAEEWRAVFADNISDSDTAEQVEEKMTAFEERMNQLAEENPDKYKKGKDAVTIPYRVVESRNLRQHQVIARRSGRDYVLTINGNPRAAQAINGETNPDNDISGAIGAVLRGAERVNRQLSAFYTTRNPDFVVSNFMRDMLYSNSMVWVKESPNYALRFHRNCLKVNPYTMRQLLKKSRKGTLDMDNPLEAMFHNFIMNGGETGYTNIRDIEQHKSDIAKQVKKHRNGKVSIKNALEWLGVRFDELNRAVENCARFAAFMTSREMGRTIDRSVYDAKEISVNFNKKGSGAKFYGATGQTLAGNASAMTSGLGRSGFVFWNAAVQGSANFGRQAKRHPAKAFTGIATIFMLGALAAYLGDDDDDDKNSYYNLPEYVRRSNILFRIGDSWVSIPLPIEYRAIYGMGELMTSLLSGREHLSSGEIAMAVAGQMTQVLPIDILEGSGGLGVFVPSAVRPLTEAYVFEKSWTGMPLYKDTPYNINMPEWTKAYKSANKYIGIPNENRTNS